MAFDIDQPAEHRAQDIAGEAGSFQDAVAAREDRRVQNLGHDAVFGGNEERAVRAHHEYGRDHHCRA